MHGKGTAGLRMAGLGRTAGSMFWTSQPNPKAEGRIEPNLSKRVALLSSPVRVRPQNPPAMSS